MASADFTRATHFIKELSTQVNTDKGNDHFMDGGDLLAWLSTLKKTSALLGQELQQQVAHHANQSFIPAYSYNEQIEQRGTRQLEDAFLSSETFLCTASHLIDRASTTSSETHHLETQTRQSHAIVTTLKKLVKIAKKLDQVESFLDKGALVESTRELLFVLDELANDEEGDLVARYRLKTKAEQYKTLLANTIHDGLTQGITTIEYERGDINVLELQIQQSIPFNQGETTLHIKDLLLASAMLQTQHVELTSIKRRLIKQFLNPFLSDFEQQWKHDLIQLDVHENTDSVVLRLTISPLLPVHNEEDSLESHESKCTFAHSMMDRSMIVVKVVFDHLFGVENHWSAIRQLFGRLFLPDVFNLLITTTIAPTVPSTSTSTILLDSLTSLAASVASFERQCIVDYAGIASYDSRATSTTMDYDFPLTMYVSHFDQHVARKRRSRLLHDARSIMLRRIYDAEPISPGGSSITQTPRVLCAMIQDIAAEVESLEQQQRFKQHYPETILTLHNTTQNILMLYSSIMPSIHRTAFLQHSDRAIVFRNDCFWLADKQQSMQQDFVVDKLRHLGEFWQKIVVSQLMNSVVAILDKTEEWQQDKSDSMVLDTKQSSHSPSVKNQSIQSQKQSEQQQQQQKQGMTLENAISVIVSIVQGLAKTIQPVVSTDLYQHILIQVVDTIVGRLTGDILSMSDISAEESHIMAQALNGVAQLANVFVSSKDNDDRDVVSEFTLRQWIPHWQGFWMVKEMLDMTMVDILSTLQRGELCMFTHKELIHLVCALFADTPRRDETLQVIKTSNLNGVELPYAAISSDLAVIAHTPVIPSSAETLPSSSPSPSSSLVSQKQHHDRGIASRDRFAFEMDETEDDGWNQDGWSDDDVAQLEFEMAPPLHKNNDRTQLIDKAFSSPAGAATATTSTSSDSVTTHSPVGSFSAHSSLPKEQEQETNRDIASSNRFAFDMGGEEDDGWNQDGWLEEEEDAQLDFKTTLPLHANNNLLDTDDTTMALQDSDNDATNRLPDTFSPEDSQGANDKEEAVATWIGSDDDHRDYNMDYQGLPDEATIDPMDYSIPGVGTTVDLDMADEGGGWSDADHDIDLDGILMPNTLQCPTTASGTVSLMFTNINEESTRNVSPAPSQSPAEDASPVPAQLPSEEASPLSATESPIQEALPVMAQSPMEDASPVSALLPTEDVSPASAQSPTEDSSLLPVQSTTEGSSPVSAQSITEDSPPVSAQPITEDSSPVSARPVTEDSSPVSARPVTEDSSPVSAQPITEDSSPVSAQPITEDSSPVSARPVTEDSSPVSARPVTEDSPSLCAQSLTEDSSPVSAQSITEDSSPLSAQLITEDSSPVSAQSITEDLSSLCAQSLTEDSSLLPTQLSIEDSPSVSALLPTEDPLLLTAQIPVSVQSPTLAYPSMSSTDFVNQYQQQDVTMAEAASELNQLEDTLKQSHYDDNNYDDDDGGWSDAENLMDFDVPLILPKENSMPDNPPTERILDKNHLENKKEDIFMATPPEKQTTSPTRSTLAMDPMPEDDTGGWSDADEDLFFK